jgi:tetratricopeptide (TPR) repeat protein
MQPGGRERTVDGTIEYPLVRPDDLAVEAWAAMTRRDADEALRLWRELREHSPERPDGHIWPIQVLWENGRLDDADTMASAAFARFPDHPDLLIQRAWVASMQQRWDDAAQRWALVRAAVPERIEGYLHGARGLWQAGQAEDAEMVASEGLARFPDHVDMIAEGAWTATARQDWQKALLRWMLVHEAQPERLDAQIGAAQALRMTGRVMDAEALVTAALECHPDNTGLLIEHIWTAIAREDWPTAGARLDHAKASAQDPARIEAQLSWVSQRLAAVSAPAVINDIAALGSAADGEEMSPSALMLAFESLGERCDFGAVQRGFGVEPLGLLRFAWTRFDSLIAALNDRFDAVGTVDDTDFALYGDETILKMKQYDLIFHTFVHRVAEEPPEKQEAFRQQQRRRLLFLKDKLIADLEEPQKICVYSTNDWASDDHAAQLFAALRAYGPNSLLFVRPARDDRQLGTVEVLEDGLYAGYFPGLNDFIAGNQPPLDLWRQLCARAYRLASGDAADTGFLKNLI